MKNRYGVPMNIYGSILPGAAKVSTIKKLSKRARERLRWMDWYDNHDHNGRLICRHFGLSPDVFYRWKSRYNPFDLSSLEDDKITRTPHIIRKPETDPQIVKRVKDLREKYPRWGKKKLWKLLQNEGLRISESSVGRTLNRLREKGQLHEPAIVVARIEKGKHRRRKVRFHAIPRDWDYHPEDPGDLIQIDTVYVYPRPGVRRYQFTACDYITKQIARCTASHNTSRAAKKIIDIIVERYPFKVLAIQIDGGSEFKAEFELECQKRGIILYVLPPHSPKLNGMVERAQRTSREEIYDIMTIPECIEDHNKLLEEQDYIYNRIRPHDSLDLLTPNQYYLSIINKGKCVRVGVN
jgi:transposase InsO family protein